MLSQEGERNGIIRKKARMKCFSSEHFEHDDSLPVILTEER
jgi:hypothetical protein